jgi:hypothetical protein
MENRKQESEFRIARWLRCGRSLVSPPSARSGDNRIEIEVCSAAASWILISEFCFLCSFFAGVGPHSSSGHFNS